MCNAHNHPPGCTCGWGQGWHSGSYGNSIYNNKNIKIYQPDTKEKMTTEKKEWLERVRKYLGFNDEKYINEKNKAEDVFVKKDNIESIELPKDEAEEILNISVDSFDDYCKSWLNEVNWSSIDISLISSVSGNLYKAYSKLSTSQEIIFLFRASGNFQVLHSRYIQKDFSSAFLSLIIKDLDRNLYIQLEGVASVGRSFPPAKKLNSVKLFKIHKSKDLNNNSIHQSIIEIFNGIENKKNRINKYDSAEFKNFCTSWKEEQDWLFFEIVNISNKKNTLYTIKNKNGLEIFFRLERTLTIHLVKYFNVSESLIFLSLIAQEIGSDIFLVLEGYGSMIESSPPKEKLKTIELFKLINNKNEIIEYLKEKNNHIKENAEKELLEIEKEIEFHKNRILELEKYKIYLSNYSIKY